MYTPYTVMDAVQEKVKFIEIKSDFFYQWTSVHSTEKLEFIKNKVYFLETNCFRIGQ